MAALLSDDIERQAKALVQYRDSTPAVRAGRHVFEATTHIGLRPTQEDRFVLVPSFQGEDCSFCGVFDGTVGDDASEFINQNVIRYLCSNLGMDKAGAENVFIATASTSVDTVGESTDPTDKPCPTPSSGGIPDKVAEKLREGIRNTFLDADGALIEMCTERRLHYASSTGVTAFLWKNLLTISHVGDSKACIARTDGNNVHPEWLTVDHKPNMPHELRRIEASGGSLAWLHGNKPYIRGGDFIRRQGKGEHPKQLNYSRAFGGKDLKMFGLTAEPDISHFEVTSEDKLVLIGSDGLWDVLNPRVACEIALRARKEGRSATDAVVSATIQEMPICGVRDNVTVIAIFLNEKK